mgnify:CR=1 FL=1
MSQRKIVAISLPLLIWLITVKLVVACSPTEPDWWFTEKFKIDQSERPIGVGLRTSDEIGSETDRRAKIFIVNHTGTKMYFLANTLPPDSIVEQPSFDLQTESFPIDMIRAGEFVNYDANYLEYLAPEFIDHNVRKPNRPQNVEVPATQKSQIQVAFGEQILTFPIELTYSLNPNYNPRNGTDNCGSMIVLVPFLAIGNTVKWISANPILSISLILIILGLIILGFIFIQQRKKRTIR